MNWVGIWEEMREEQKLKGVLIFFNVYKLDKERILVYIEGNWNGLW